MLYTEIDPHRPIEYVKEDVPSLAEVQSSRADENVKSESCQVSPSSGAVSIRCRRWGARLRHCDLLVKNRFPIRVLTSMVNDLNKKMQGDRKISSRR
jgi:hypothetical protein